MKNLVNCLLVAVLVFSASASAGPTELVPAAPAAAAQEPAPNPVVGSGFDLAAAENGGRVEWVSSQYSTSGPAMNLIATTRHAGWSGAQTAPHEIVFSFFNRQDALVASVLINPMTRDNNDRPQDVEIWVSGESPTEGFTRVAAATLVKEDSLQPVEFAPVDARFVKLRILSTSAPVPDTNPGGFAVGASRVKIMEGERPGYISILARNPELAALAAGIIPVAPPEAARPTPPAGGADSCSLPSDEPPKPSTFPQSTQVLVVTDDANLYRAIVWESANTDTLNREGRAVVPGVGFTWVTPGVAAPVHLIAEPRVDTVIFAQACEINDDVSSAFKQALLAWVAAGHKLIIQDSDYCAGSRTPKYDFIPYPFATLNPGASGASGEAGVLENSTLASNNKADAAFIDTGAWQSGPNDLGDSNIIVQYDARWCGAMWAKNKLQMNGFALAYAHYGRGLVIYDGFDMDQGANPVYQQLVTRELLQPFDGDHLPCSQPLGGFIITTSNELKTQAMAAGKTYTYPMEVLGNFGYTGRVTLEATVIPADPAVTVALDTPLADLTEVDEATTSLTVTAADGASLSSKIIAVRGVDTEGKSNVLCLNLPERRSGSVQILSGLRQDKKPPRNIEIILDASGSMKAMLGGKSRWAVAQDVLKEVVAKLPADFSVGLRAYGHTLSSKDPNTCTDTALVLPVVPLNTDQLLALAQGLAPRGETPLVYSILQTPADLQAVGGGTVILITDGEESCKGDFAAAEETLKASGLNLVLNIVGFTLDNAPAEVLLNGLAESTGGNYYGAANGEALARAIMLAAVDRLAYRILDAAGAEVARGEAGNTGPHELAAGDFTLVITAAGEELRTPVKIEVGKDIVLKALIKSSQLVVETSSPS